MQAGGGGVKKRLDELKIYYQSTIGRKARIIELKQKVNKPIEQLVKERRYGV